MNSSTVKEKIILAITQDMKIYECFVDNLKFLNFEVFLICNIGKDLKYKNFYDRLHNLFRKTILKDKSFKKKLFKKYELKNNLNYLKLIPNCDYSLTIRADLFNDKVLKAIVEKSSKNYSYQWDGLSRFPDIYKSLNLFNKFYVFDKKDLNYENKTYPINNFYFDCYTLLFANKKPEFDVYYIGSYDARINKLIQICEHLKSKNLKLNIIICGKPKIDLSSYSYIKIVHDPLNYYENLKMVANCKILIDLHHENLHKGLSFRTFEALGYEKKLITSNRIVSEYDFYNKNNIHIIEDDKMNLDDFLNTNYQEVNQEIKAKYSFTNWIKYVLEKDNSIPLFIH
ncbi:hypothetical protein [Flavobacterium sp.]|uniref:hypothetical protein n=1 Tax=Flavobacterium sp. TaxID=239 RepID=UPI003750978B